MLLDAETKVTRRAKVFLQEFKLLHLQTRLQDLQRFVSVADGHVARNLFVTTNTERTDGVSRLGEDRLLTGELLEHLRRFRETIARFPDGDVEDELVDCLLYTSPSPRDATLSRMPSSA